jgi:predicted transcriptional regulator
MFENVLEGEDVAAIQSAKGKHSIDIDVAALREKREEVGFSLQELSELIGISKKALYEIEKKRTNPSFETVERLEKMLNVELRKNYEMKKIDRPTYLEPKNNFQKAVSKQFNRIGIENSPVDAAPFEIVGKESFSVITNLTPNANEIKDVKKVKKLSAVLSTKAFYIAKKSKEENVEGIPVLLESELSDIKTSRDLTKRMREKA